ncbi:unnamed protein product [Coregonus sp. 'balchen']|nr:unnamed protein product [Coregonus sp. 'balchen']
MEKSCKISKFFIFCVVLGVLSVATIVTLWAIALTDSVEVVAPWDRYRLPDTLKPDHYNLTLWPRLTVNAQGLYIFTGESYVVFQCVKETDLILIHSNKLNYTKWDDGHLAKLTALGSTPAPTIKKSWLQLTTQFLVLELNGKLAVGESYQLDTVFVGELADDLAEILNVTVNTESVTQTRFEPTKSMSTYLLALIVCDYSNISAQERNIQKDLIVLDDVHRVFAVDALASSHPLSSKDDDIQKPEQIIDASDMELPGTVHDIMNRWVLQMGFPVVTINTATGQITQEHFLLDPDSDYVKNLVTPLFQHFKTITANWSKVPDGHTDQYNQVNAIRMACSTGLVECQNLTKGWYSQWMADPDNNLYLRYTLDSDKIRKQDATSVIVYISSNVEGTLALEQATERTTANIKWVDENKKEVWDWFLSETA